jgi:hypothetical protein
VAATSSRAGLTMRHGPHQGAHRSTTTGRDAAPATSGNVVSPASAVQGSGWWQLPQRGMPDAAAGTRLRCPQWRQRTSPAGIEGAVIGYSWFS